jgi:ADP-ribose pyrophosphatase YjhB (NUDIX family)
MQPHWYIVNVEAAIVKDNRYLMILRGEGETHAPGVLAMPGGKVENAGQLENVLEETLRREISEEVGVEVYPQVEYVKSDAFIADDGNPVVNLVFLCRFKSGIPTPGDPREVAAVHWMTAKEIVSHPKTPPWTRQSIQLVEQKRVALNLRAKPT